MPDLYMPDVIVEVAFNAGYTTPAASRTWTDVSSYVELHEGIDIDVGRRDERSTADANTLTLTLDNTDGRFTAGRAASPYYPNVKVGRPIRVRVTPPGGTTSTRFVGFVDEWPVEWDGSDRYARAPIRAASRMSRLGLNAKLRSTPEQEILASRPVRYWTLGDPSGSTSASESSGNSGGPLLMWDNVENGVTDDPVIFGNATGPYTDGLTAAQFTGADPDADPAQSLRLYEYFGDLSGSGLRGIRCTLLINAIGTSPTAGGIVFGFFPEGGSEIVSVRLTPTTGLLVTTGATTEMSGPDLADGATHDIAFLWNATTSYLIVDGVVVDTESSAGLPTSGRIQVVYAGNNLSGVMSHCAIWDASSSITTAAAQAQAEAVLTGFAGDRTDERVVRVLGWAGVPASEVTVETGVETMTYQLTEGLSATDAAREAESTEGGVLFDGRDGNVTFHNRSHRYLSTAAATLNMASQHVGSDYSPKLDRSTLLNDVEVSNPSTGEKARAVDTDSADEYGIATGSATSVADTSDPLQQKAFWVLRSYAEPRLRVPSLTVDVLAHQGLTPSAQTLLGLTVGDLLAVSNAPSQSDTTTPSYFVEGYTESIGPESYEITFNLSPTYPTLNTFVVGDATRGQLDSSYVLAL